MTSALLHAADVDATGDDAFAELRRTEFAHLDEQGVVYLDYTGAAVASASQLRAHDALLRGSLLGNPHSEHAPSRASTVFIERARERMLRHFGASCDEYDVIFTANASAAIKLVAEAFPFRRGSRLVLTADNHNSMNGVAEYARRHGATTLTVALTPELYLSEPHTVLAARPPLGPSLFGFPAQSNFSGVRHPLQLITAAQRLGFRVLLDAASFVPSSPLSLRALKPDFVAVSLYKMFGFPTGVGALIGRRDALHELRRPWFAGGTVDWASVEFREHRLRPSAAAFEDGTPNFYGLAAAHAGFDLLERVDLRHLSARVAQMIGYARMAMATKRHANGSPVFRVYGPADARDQGGTMALNLLSADGTVIPYEDVERRAREARLAVRGGCFCNPGASEAAFGFGGHATRRCLRATSETGFTPRRFAQCLGDGTAVGAIRLSVGLATSDTDLRSGVALLAAIGRELGGRTAALVAPTVQPIAAV